MQTVTDTDAPINIAIIGVTEIRDELLYRALPLMGRNLDEFEYRLNEHDVMQTAPLWFNFANKPLTFQETGDNDDFVRINMVPHCHGAIISLRMVAPDCNYRKHKGWMAGWVLHYNEIVYQAKLPAICVLEDNRDSFQWILISNPDLVEDPETEAYWRKPPDFVTPSDNIWQPNSQTLRAIRENLSIPPSVPILPYTYRRPASLRNMVARLLHKIDPSLLIKPETRFAGTPKPLKIAVIGLADPQDRMEHLHDPMLYPALMLMSLNLDEATYHTDENGFDHTPPLRFDFTPQTFVFSRPATMVNIGERLQDGLLPDCDGVIVNEYHVNSRTPPHLVFFLKEVYALIYAAKLPTIFVQCYGSESAMGKAKQVLAVPENIPFISYHYDEPISLQHLLTTLLAEIDKANLAKEGPQA